MPVRYQYIADRPHHFSPESENLAEENNSRTMYSNYYKLLKLNKIVFMSTCKPISSIKTWIPFPLTLEALNIEDIVVHLYICYVPTTVVVW